MVRTRVGSFGFHFMFSHKSSVLVNHSTLPTPPGSSLRKLLAALKDYFYPKAFNPFFKKGRKKPFEKNKHAETFRQGPGKKISQWPAF